MAPAHGQLRPHELPITPATAAWGYYDAAAPPVLRIKSGETVTVHTLITSTPARLEGAGLPAAQVEPNLRDITDARNQQRARAGTSSPGPSSWKAPSPATCWKCAFRP